MVNQIKTRTNKTEIKHFPANDKFNGKGRELMGCQLFRNFGYSGHFPFLIKDSLIMLTLDYGPVPN